MTSLRDRIIAKVNRRWGFTRRNDIGAADIVDVVLAEVRAELLSNAVAWIAAVAISEADVADNNGTPEEYAELVMAALVDRIAPAPREFSLLSYGPVLDPPHPEWRVVTVDGIPAGTIYAVPRRLDGETDEQFGRRCAAIVGLPEHAPEHTPGEKP